jgi:hypothetical protein
VPVAQSWQLFDAAGRQGLSVHLHLIHGAGHTGPAFVTTDINEMVDTFFSRSLPPAGPNQPDLDLPFITESTAR